MHTDGLAETQKLQVPQDLVSALGQHKPKTDYGHRGPQALVLRAA